MEWFSSTELMGVAGLPKTDRQLRNIIKELSLRTPEKVRQRAGSKASEVHISLLPPSVQAALWRRQGLIEVNGKLLQLPKEKSAEKKERYCKEEVWSRWNKATTDQQARARKKLEVVMAVYSLVRNGTGKMDAYNTVSEQFGVSRPSVIRWCGFVKEYAQDDWAPVLLDDYSKGAEQGMEKRVAPIDSALWEALKADYLRQERPTFSACFMRIKRVAEANGATIPSESSLRRRMEREVALQQRVLLREGEHALHQMYPPQQRSVMDLEALQWITGDGYQHNVFVRWFNGEILRPKTWFWMDVYSRKIVGWRCDVSENADSIRLSLMDVCSTYGIPREVTIDNTRAAANKWMTGGVPNRYRFKVKPDDPKGIIPILGMELHWTSVILGKGHGQAKPIERAFGVGGLDELVDKHPLLAGAYTGPNPMDKPDNYGDRAVEAEVFLRALAEGVEMFNSRTGRETEVCRGIMSFDQAFNASYQSAVIRKATPEQLRLLMLQAEAVTVSQHGTISLDAGGSIASRKNRYGCAELYEYLGKKVVARFDPQSLHSGVVVYTLDGLLIGEAECLEKVGFGDTQAAREHKRRRTQFVKSTKEAAAAKRSMTALEVAAMMPGASGDDTQPETRVVEMVRPVSVGNTALAAETITQDEFEARFQAGVANLLAQKAKRI